MNPRRALNVSLIGLIAVMFSTIATAHAIAKPVKPIAPTQSTPVITLLSRYCGKPYDYYPVTINSCTYIKGLNQSLILTQTSSSGPTYQTEMYFDQSCRDDNPYWTPVTSVGSYPCSYAGSDDNGVPTEIGIETVITDPYIVSTYTSGSCGGNASPLEHQFGIVEGQCVPSDTHSQWMRLIVNGQSVDFAFYSDPQCVYANIGGQWSGDLGECISEGPNARSATITSNSQHKPRGRRVTNRLSHRHSDSVASTILLH